MSDNKICNRCGGDIEPSSIGITDYCKVCRVNLMGLMKLNVGGEYTPTSKIDDLIEAYQKMLEDGGPSDDIREVIKDLKNLKEGK